jgi:hypothetical protein
MARNYSTTYVYPRDGFNDIRLHCRHDDDSVTVAVAEGDQGTVYVTGTIRACMEWAMELLATLELEERLVEPSRPAR